MNSMTDIGYVSGLKSNMHAVFDTPQGKEILEYLELTCCWYSPVFVPQDPQMTLINDGKRQVISTIKTILDLSPDMIVNLAKQKEETNG